MANHQQWLLGSRPRWTWEVVGAVNAPGEASLPDNWEEEATTGNGLVGGTGADDQLRTMSSNRSWSLAMARVAGNGLGGLQRVKPRMVERKKESAGGMGEKEEIKKKKKSNSKKKRKKKKKEKWPCVKSRWGLFHIFKNLNFTFKFLKFPLWTQIPNFYFN